MSTMLTVPCGGASDGVPSLPGTSRLAATSSIARLAAATASLRVCRLPTALRLAPLRLKAAVTTSVISSSMIIPMISAAPRWVWVERPACARGFMAFPSGR
ncbi:hypothetical protein D9M69_552810 [compost metagenome]